MAVPCCILCVAGIVALAATKRGYLPWSEYHAFIFLGLAAGLLGFVYTAGMLDAYEPVSYTHLDVYKRQGLDLSVQANVLDLIKKIQRELGVSMLVVSHDLGVIRMLADRTIVMLDGEIIEQGLTDQVMEDPQHPYTQQLVYSLL